MLVSIWHTIIAELGIDLNSLWWLTETVNVSLVKWMLFSTTKQELVLKLKIKQTQSCKSLCYHWYL